MCIDIDCCQLQILRGHRKTTRSTAAITILWSHVNKWNVTCTRHYLLKLVNIMIISMVQVFSLLEKLLKRFVLKIFLLVFIKYVLWHTKAPSNFCLLFPHLLFIHLEKDCVSSSFPHPESKLHRKCRSSAVSFSVILLSNSTSST